MKHSKILHAMSQLVALNFWMILINLGIICLILYV